MNPYPRTRVNLLAIAGVGLVGGALGQSSLDNQLKQIDTLTRVQTLAVSLNLYATDYDSTYPNPPDIKGLKWAMAPYVKDANSWKTLNPKKSELRFNTSVGGASKLDMKDPSQYVLFYDSDMWPNRERPVAFADGSAKSLTSIEWGRTAMSLASRFEKRAGPLPKAYSRQWKEPATTQSK